MLLELRLVAIVLYSLPQRRAGWLGSYNLAKQAAMGAAVEAAVLRLTWCQWAPSRREQVAEDPRHRSRSASAREISLVGHIIMMSCWLY